MVKMGVRQRVGRNRWLEWGRYWSLVGWLAISDSFTGGRENSGLLVRAGLSQPHQLEDLRNLHAHHCSDSSFDHHGHRLWHHLPGNLENGVAERSSNQVSHYISALNTSSLPSHLPFSFNSSPPLHPSHSANERIRKVGGVNQVWLHSTTNFQIISAVASEVDS